MILFLWLTLVVAIIVLMTTRWEVHPFLALVFGAVAMGFLAGLETPEVISSIADGFGATLASIGIVIAAGAIIGEYLDRSGGAKVLAHRILSKVGERNAPLSMSLTGGIVSIPVFCDAGFIVLSGLNKAIARRTKMSLTVLAVALASGLYATHVFVPPTPGPLAAAATLGADIGWVLILGLVVSVPVLAASLFWATNYCDRYETNAEKVEEPHLQEEPSLVASSSQSLGARPQKTSTPSGLLISDEPTDVSSSAPSFKVAVAPILAPIFLIALKSIAELPAHPVGEGYVYQALVFLGDPIIALLVGILLALLMVKGSRSYIQNAWMEDALKKAGIIILITGAGGAFGEILRQTDLSDVAMQFANIETLGMAVPFLIAAFLKSAQGSSTVAIITAAAITAPLVAPLGFDSTIGTALVVLAIGAGSLTVSHVNDSYFWVVAKFSDMEMMTALKTHTVATLIMGVTGLVTIQLLAWILL